jgi:hypothetical protein
MKTTELTADKAREMAKKAMKDYNPETDGNYGLVKQKIKDAIENGFDFTFVLDDKDFTGFLEQQLIDEGFAVSNTNEKNEIEIAWEPQ